LFTIKTVGVDYDDLIAHFVCTNTGEERAIIDITEVFPTGQSEYTNSSFSLGISSSAPFRAEGANYYRAPRCTLFAKYCSAGNEVHSCEAEKVTTTPKSGWVLNKDRVYVVPKGEVQPFVCEAAVHTCCNYISNAVDGSSICSLDPHSNDELFHIEPKHQEEHHDDDEHRHHDDDEHRHHDDDEHRHHDDDEHRHHDDDEHRHHDDDHKHFEEEEHRHWNEDENRWDDQWEHKKSA